MSTLALAQLGETASPQPHRAVVSKAASLAGLRKHNGLTVWFCLSQFMKESPDKAANFYAKASPIGWTQGCPWHRQMSDRTAG
jgi:hypothetical protein